MKSFLVTAPLVVLVCLAVVYQRYHQRTEREISNLKARLATTNPRNELMKDFIRHDLDRGVDAATVKEMCRKLTAGRPGYGILSMRTLWDTISFDLATPSPSNPEIVTVALSQTGSVWKQEFTLERATQALPLADLIEILDLMSKEGLGGPNGILSIVVEHGSVDITTGESNHSLGGSGVHLRFEKRGLRWTLKYSGSWIADESSRKGAAQPAPPSYVVCRRRT